MKPNPEKRLDAFVKLGIELQKVIHRRSLKNDSFQQAILKSTGHNPWFTEENIFSAMEGISAMLDKKKLTDWINRYDFSQALPKKLTVGVIMAGNIPLVGFHDFMCVLLSGHRFLGKLSGQDKFLPVEVARLLTEIEPGFRSYIGFTEGVISDFDAVIATGSNNTSRYFEYYFKKYPSIIRGNRNSLAIVDGKESEEELMALSDDVFMYFGMGCRSVSKIYVPENYDFDRLVQSFRKWEHLKNHHKFFNNYEYQKAVLLVNQTPHFDTGYSIVKEDNQLASPLSVLHYETYDDFQIIQKYIESEKNNIQCIASRQELNHMFERSIKTGTTQNPGPEDYADGVDTIEFLLELK
ncbi:MAG: acyl-CoA reductase [Bacteroidetes bacterium]|nr:MAG: acyl-CoA reductase [Bacteroidota bacterium]